MSRNLQKALTLVLALSMLLAMLAGCGGTPSGAEGEPAGTQSGGSEDGIKTVTMAMTSPWRFLNNYIPNGNEPTHIAQNIMYLQYAITLSDGTVTPLLLESWDVSEDGMT